MKYKTHIRELFSEYITAKKRDENQFLLSQHNRQNLQERIRPFRVGSNRPSMNLHFHTNLNTFICFKRSLATNKTFLADNNPTVKGNYSVVLIDRRMYARMSVALTFLHCVWSLEFIGVPLTTYHDQTSR